MTKDSSRQKRGLGRRIAVSFKRDFGSWILLVPTLILFIIVLWQPLLSGLVLSFFETSGYETVRFNGLQNYRDIITNSEFTAALVNSFAYTFWSLAIGFLMPLVVAMMLNEMVHLKALYRFTFYFPSMIPGMATALLWYFIFDPGEGGVLNMILALFGRSPSMWLQNSALTIPLIVITMTWRGFGGTMLIYLAALQGINQDLYEAASIDGAGFFRKVWHIEVPQLKSMIMLMLIRQIIGVFQVMQEPLAMTGGGPNNASISLMLESYYYGFRYFEAGRSMAVGAVTFVILAVLTVIYQLISKRQED
ncbi:MAG: carbohydrate ABC transporter permease [Oscillospiraceae bacterium]